MKEELLNILIKLKEQGSWDLAEELAFWVHKTPTLKESYIDSIISFLNIASKNAKDNNQINNLVEAKNKLMNIKRQEQLEREQEFQNIELELSNI